MCIEFMLPEAALYNEWYSGLHQFQVLDTVGYQSVDIQANWMLAVMYRHRGASNFSICWYDRRASNRPISRQKGGPRRAHRIAGSALHLARRSRFDRTEVGGDREDCRRGRLREPLGDGPFLPDRGGRRRRGTHARGL